MTAGAGDATEGGNFRALTGAELLVLPEDAEPLAACR